MPNANDLLRQIAAVSEQGTKRGPRILWSGGYYMTNGQTASLNEPVTAQRSGIVLVWSYYGTSAENSRFTSFFVPKQLVAAMPGMGHKMSSLGCAGGDPNMAKYVYVYDDHVSGYSSNASTITNGDGTKAQNAHFVLRYVFGV